MNTPSHHNLYVRGATSLGCEGKRNRYFLFRFTVRLVYAIESILRFVDGISFLVSVMFQPARTRRAPYGFFCCCVLFFRDSRQHFYLSVSSFRCVYTLRALFRTVPHELTKK